MAPDALWVYVAASLALIATPGQDMIYVVTRSLAQGPMAGIASALGVIAGSAAYALATRSFRWEGFRDAEDTANHVVGGILMGFGGITALGCTIGQAITGVSTLAIGSFLTFFAIVAGSAATMKYQYWRMGG